ncbi:MAG: hypothetical protein FWE22_04850 [Firmicutes bacterium]|nr:hypothetical protein [Bacillota bacterium]
MKTDKQTLEKIRDLLDEYFNEIAIAEKKGYLQKNTVTTYVTHSGNFVKWCAGEFEPGKKNK